MLVRTSKDKEHPYVMLNKTFLEDQNLSLKAKGLLAYCMSKPDGWQFHVDQLLKVLKEGKDAIYSAFKELKKYGYCQVEQKRGKSGRVQAVDYILFETPQREELKKCLPQPGFPYTDKPLTDYPLADNPQLVINEDKVIKENVRKRSDVPSFIQEIEGITEEDKKILARYPEDHVKAAIEYSKVVPPIESKIKQLMYFSRLDKPVKIPKNLSNHLYEYLVEWSKNHSSTTCILRIDKKSVTFEHSGQGLDKPVVRFAEEDASEKIGNLLKRYKFKPIKK